MERVPDESGPAAARALLHAAVFFAERGVRIERVLTDNGRAYTAAAVYADAVASIGARSQRTRAYRRQTNGKAEPPRSRRTTRQTTRAADPGSAFPSR